MAQDAESAQPVAADDYDWPAPTGRVITLDAAETEADDWSVSSDPGAESRPVRRSSDDSVVTTERARGESQRNHVHDPVSIDLPAVRPLPAVPDPGILNTIQYTVAVLRARWQRRGAAKDLEHANQRDKADLDESLVVLGKQTRILALHDPTLDKENEALDRAEARRAEIEHACDELSNRQAEEDNAFATIEEEQRDQQSKLEAERSVVQTEIDDLEARRRGTQEKLDTVTRQQRGYVKAAEQRDEQAGRAAMGDARSGLRRAAEELRRDAHTLEAEKQDHERRLAELERPISQALANRESLNAQLDSVHRVLQEARDDHRHRLAEMEAEQNRRNRELSQADAEIGRHLMSLGTLVNLHRIEHADLTALYTRIDELRSAMGSRSTAIDRLSAESEAYDHESYKRGLLLMGGTVLGVLLFIMILFAAC